VVLLATLLPARRSPLRALAARVVPGPPEVRRVPSRPGTMCFGGAQSRRERSCAPTELYATGGARILPEETIWVSQALLHTERGRGRRHLTRISTSGSGTGSGLSGTTEGFHQLWTLHLLSLYSLSLPLSPPRSARRRTSAASPTTRTKAGGRERRGPATTSRTGITCMTTWRRTCRVD
jgi:hypothetical protein